MLGGTAESPDLGGVVAANGAGVGDHYEDADCYLRNELAELQITSADKLRKAVEQMPKNVRGKNEMAKPTDPFDPVNDSKENVIWPGNNPICHRKTLPSAGRRCAGHPTQRTHHS